MPTTNYYIGGNSATTFTLNSAFQSWSDASSTPTTQGYTTPSTANVAQVFNTSSIPAGSTINSATLYATAGGSSYGGYHTQAGFATMSGLDVKSLVTAGSNTSIPYTFKSYTAGASYPAVVPGTKTYANKSGTTTFSSLYLVISYTEPYSKCAPPNSVTTNYASRIPGGSATLSWSGAGAGTNNAITGYHIYRSTSAAGTYTYLTDVTTTATSGSVAVTASDTNGETYYYKVYTIGTVSGFNSDISSAYASLKAEVSACTAPTSVSVNGTDVAPGTSKTLSWSGAGAGTNNAITRYDVYSAATAGGTYAYLGQTTGTTMTVTSPSANNSSTYYKVKAIATVSGYDSDLSSTYGILTTTVTAPSAPSAVSVANGVDVAPIKTRTLSWSGAAAGTNDTIKGYHVFRSLDGGAYSYLAEILTTSTSESLVVTSAASAGTYAYKIKTLGNSFSLISDLSSSYGSLTTATIKSTGSLDKTTVAADGSSQIAVAITPQTDTSYTHKVTWYIEPTNYTSGVRSLVAADYYDAMTIPAGWVAGIAQLSITGTCVVETFNGATSLGSNIYTFTVTVPPASAFVLDKSTVEANGSATIRATVTANHSTYTHEVTWYANATYNSVNSIAAGVAYHQYTVPLSWCNATPNSDTFTASCTVKTYKSSGTVLVGSDTRSFNFTVPASVIPSVSTFTAAQVEGYWSLYVKTKSKCSLTLTAAGAYGSTVSSFRIVGAGQDSLSQAYTVGIQWTSGYLQIFGSQTFTVTITDSRGRTAQGTASITVTDYTPPSITAATYARATSGGVASNTGTYINAKGTFSFSAIGSNSITAKTYYRQVGSGTWLPAGGTAITSNTTVTHGAEGILLANPHETKIDLSDYFGTVTNLGSVPVATKVFDMRETRASFGRFATNDKELAIPADWDFVKGSIKASYEGHTHSYAPLTGAGTSGTWPIAISGNAATATSAATWTTARNLTIGLTAKSVNGSAAVAWTLAEIGAAAAAHAHTIANISDFPASLPASDVYAWAKAAAKPAYTNTEVGAAATGHTHSYAPLTGAGTSGSWPISITGSSASCTGNAATATTAGRAYPYRIGGVDLNFNWSGQAGQPPWLWGGSDGSNMYVYNPSNFSVANANTVGGRSIYASTAGPSGGVSGDIYIKYI